MDTTERIGRIVDLAAEGRLATWFDGRVAIDGFTYTIRRLQGEIGVRLIPAIKRANEAIRAFGIAITPEREG